MCHHWDTFNTISNGKFTILREEVGRWSGETKRARANESREEDVLQVE